MDITVEQLKDKLDRGETPVLLDVREIQEVKIASIGGTHIPMNLVPLRIQELDPSKEIIVYCHSGGRSAAIVNFLQKHGFDNVRNLLGGIDEWSLSIDPKVPRY